MTDLFDDVDLITVENMQNFKKPGVWALFGNRKNSEDKTYYCLQVGQKKDNIMSEIVEIQKFLNEEFEDKFFNRTYINYFKEKLFDYNELPTYREILYGREIKDKFENYRFIFICEESNSQKLREIEKMFAIETQSLYFRNGRPFKEGQDFDFNNRSSVNSECEKKVKFSKEISNFIAKYKAQRFWE